MATLRTRYELESWYQQLESYLLNRIPSVEERLLGTFRYVELHAKNRNTFSNEFASILRDAGSIFGTALDTLVKNTNPRAKRNPDFRDFRGFLQQEAPDIHEQTICVRSCLPAGIVVPFEELSEKNGTPNWWDAYNKVKHTEMASGQMGNLEHCVSAIAAIVLVNEVIGLSQYDPLFVNVGLKYDLKSVDMSIERRLFPPINKTI